MMNGRISMWQYLQTLYQMCQTLNIGESYQPLAYALGIRSGSMLTTGRFLRELAQLTIEAERAGFNSNEIQALLTNFAAGGLVHARAAIHLQAQKEIIARANVIDELFETAKAEDVSISATIEQQILNTAAAIKEIREHAQLDQTIDPGIVNAKPDAGLLETIKSEDAPEQMQKYVQELEADPGFRQLDDLVMEYEAAQTAMAQQAADSPEYKTSSERLTQLVSNIRQLASTPHIAAKINNFGQNIAPLMQSSAHAITQNALTKAQREALDKLSRIARVLELAMNIKGSNGFGNPVATPDSNKAPTPFYGQSKHFKDVLAAAANFGNR